MTEPLSATHQYLLANYGPLLTFKHLAEVMHISPNGVRMAIARKRQPLAVALCQARRQLGRRVYFDAHLVAEAIDLCGSARVLHRDYSRMASSADKNLTEHEKCQGGI